MNRHPSRLALDRARLGDSSGEVTAHLQECSACRDYVQARLDTPVPAWARALESPRQPAWLAMAWPRWTATALVTAAAAVLWLGITPQTKPPGRYIGVKAATPAVEVFLRRQGRVVPWTGQGLRTGDRIQLRISPADFEQISVVAKNPNGFVPIHRQTISETERGASIVLSRSFRVDGTTTDNDLIVLLSRAPVTPEALRQPPDTSTTDLWVQRLHFKKEIVHE